MSQFILAPEHFVMLCLLFMIVIAALAQFVETGPYCKVLMFREYRDLRKRDT